MNVLCSNLIPINTKKIRIGPNSDGGYVLGSNYLSSVIYSYGVGNNIGFEESYLKLLPNTKITFFDGTIDSLPASPIDQNKNTKFVKKNVYRDDDLCITEPGCLVMMDIEGCEFDLILSATDRTFNNIKQLCVEVHFDKKLPLEKSLDFLRKLNEHFYLIHIHANNHKKRLYFNVPCVLELTYVNKTYFNEQVIIESTPFPIKNLDFANIVNKKDIKTDWWIR